MWKGVRLVGDLSDKSDPHPRPVIGILESLDAEFLRRQHRTMDDDGRF